MNKLQQVRAINKRNTAARIDFSLNQNQLKIKNTKHNFIKMSGSKELKQNEKSPYCFLLKRESKTF